MKKLLTVDDYREAWRLQDAGKGWIVYREEADYYCPPDVIGFDRDQMEGGISGLPDTETRLAGFLFAIQPDRKKPDLSDVYEYAKRAGLRVIGDPTDNAISPMTKDMLDHERYFLDDTKVGCIWKSLREKDRLMYALLIYSLHRQNWARNWGKMTNKVLLELDKHGLDVGQLRTLKRIDTLSIERAQEYKTAAVHVPKRLRRTLKQLQGIASEESAVSSATQIVVEQKLVEYASFLKEYRRRRKHRFETLAEHHFQTLAGPLTSLLKDPRGRPSLKNLAQRAAKAVFIELADELIHAHGLPVKKSTRIAGRITCLLFPKERVNSNTDPSDNAFSKKVLDEYKYAKKSLESV